MLEKCFSLGQASLAYKNLFRQPSEQQVHAASDCGRNGRLDNKYSTAGVLCNAGSRSGNHGSAPKGFLVLAVTDGLHNNLNCEARCIGVFLERSVHSRDVQIAAGGHGAQQCHDAHEAGMQATKEAGTIFQLVRAVLWALASTCASHELRMFQHCCVKKAEEKSERRTVRPVPRRVISTAHFSCCDTSCNGVSEPFANRETEVHLGTGSSW
jgi:hypothetical protein